MFTGSDCHGIVVVQSGDRVGNVYSFLTANGIFRP